MKRSKILWSAGGLVLLIAIWISGLSWLSLWQTRHKVRWAEGDLRSLASGLESYFETYQVYPPTKPMNRFAGNPDELKQAGFEEISFLDDDTTEGIALGFNEFWDAYALFRHKYAYFTDGHDWVLWTAGPDGKYDLTAGMIKSKGLRELREQRDQFIYDPTNGLTSGGDIVQLSDVRQGEAVK